MDRFYISDVLTNNVDWKEFKEKYKEELGEILDACYEYINEKYILPRENLIYKILIKKDYSQTVNDPDKKNKKELIWMTWNYILKKKLGWDTFLDETKKIKNFTILDDIGPTKNGISVKFNFNDKIEISRWIFDSTHLAIKSNYCDIPILILINDEKLMNDFLANEYLHYESIFKEIVEKSLFNKNTKYLILGIKMEEVKGINITEVSDLIEEDGNRNTTVFNELLRFEPWELQAGLNILNYFSTYLKKNYPVSDATVSIQQENEIVRMIITSVKGEKEIIEQALNDYGSILSGESMPEDFAKSKSSKMELQNKLDIANLELKFQKQMLDAKIDDIEYLKGEIKGLRNTLAEALKQPLNLNFNANPNLIAVQNNTQTINIQLDGVAKLLEEIKESASTPEQKEEVAEVAKAVQAVQKDPTKEVVKKKGIITKLKGLSENITKGMGAFTKTADATEKAAKSAQKIYQLGEKLLPYIDKISDFLI